MSGASNQAIEPPDTHDEQGSSSQVPSAGPGQTVSQTNEESTRTASPGRVPATDTLPGFRMDDLDSDAFDFDMADEGFRSGVSGSSGSGPGLDLNNVVLESRTSFLGHGAEVEDYRQGRRIILGPSGSPIHSSPLPESYLSAVRQAYNPRAQQPEPDSASPSPQSVSDQDDEDDEDESDSSSSRSYGSPGPSLEHPRLIAQMPYGPDGSHLVENYATGRQYLVDRWDMLNWEEHSRPQYTGF